MVLWVGSSCGVIILAVLSVVTAYDRVKFAQNPPVQTDFTIEKWMGRWYVQARLASCAWSGSNEFDDWTTHQTLQPGNSVLGVETWLAPTGICSTMGTRLFPRNGGNGCFVVKDPIGNVLTGEQYVVATDYKSITVTWGCVKRSVDGVTCDDPWVTVMTRDPHPTPNEFKVVEAILQKVFSLSLTEMRKVNHTDRCRTGGQAQP